MKNKKLLIAVIAFVAIIGIMLGVYFVTREKPDAGSKKITVIVVHKDGSEKNFQYTTTQAYLGAVLLENKLVENEEGPYGLFIKTADGERAVYELDKAYWALYIGDTEASTGADGVAIQDGGIYKLVYTGA